MLNYAIRKIASGLLKNFTKLYDLPLAFQLYALNCDLKRNDKTEIGMESMGLFGMGLRVWE
jgi:hypothetical protein